MIGFLHSLRFRKFVFLILLIIAALQFRATADDQIKKKDGTVITGQIVKVSNGQVFVNRAANGAPAQVIPFYLTDITSATMTPPPDMEKAKDATPAAAIALLEPLVKQYSALPANWVVDAMVQLADAYDAQGNGDRAQAMYNQINQLYPGSPYLIQAAAGQAKLSLDHGKVDAAIAALQPLIDKANQNLAPSPDEGRLYARVFLVYGEALEAQKKLPQALEAYLTVKTIFYQNSTLAEQAGQLADKLRRENPGLSVD